MNIASLIILFIVLECASGFVNLNNIGDKNNLDNELKQNGTMEHHLAEQLLAVLDHYKKENAVGVPGLAIDDPLPVPDITKNLAMTTLSMKDVKAYGLSQFHLTSIRADLQSMEVNAVIELDELFVRGSYILKAWIDSTGPFTVVLKRVMVRGTASMEVDDNGHFTSKDLNMNITFGNLAMDFKNLGIVGSVFQGVINSAPNVVFDAMTPLMLKDAKKKMKVEIDKNVEKILGDRLLPNSIVPLDMAIAVGRKKLRNMGYDPYQLPTYNRTIGVFTMQLSNFWVKGLSNLYRICNISVGLENQQVQVILQISTQQITVLTDVEVNFGLISRVGHIVFTVQSIHLMVDLSQPADTSDKPRINDIEIELGNIQLRVSGGGSLDYLAELSVNILPNLLRYEVMNALKQSIKMRLQEELNKVDVKHMIKTNVNLIKI